MHHYINITHNTGAHTKDASRRRGCVSGATHTFYSVWVKNNRIWYLHRAVHTSAGGGFWKHGPVIVIAWTVIHQKPQRASHTPLTFERGFILFSPLEWMHVHTCVCVWACVTLVGNINQCLPHAKMFLSPELLCHPPVFSPFFFFLLHWPPIETRNHAEDSMSHRFCDKCSEWQGVPCLDDSYKLSI